MNSTKIKKINDDHIILSFHKSTEMFSMLNYGRILQSRGFKITNRYQKGSDIIVTMKRTNN